MRDRRAGGARLLPPAVLAVTAVALVGAACGGDGDPVAPSSADLVWEDEFDGPAGQLPDASRWQFDVGTDWGNRQLEFDTDRPENVSLDGEGNLAITARREPFAGSAYTSGRIKTQDLFEPTYGRVEARIQVPLGRGLWPAFWLLGANIDQVGWPACGEIDVMEFIGHEPSAVHGSLHGPGYSGGASLTTRYELANDRFDTGFHTFAVEWRSGRIDWFVDGELYKTVRRGDPPGDWAFDGPYFIILNLAVGGNWPGPPDANTRFPATMLVDWVRVYRLDAA